MAGEPGAAAREGRENVQGGGTGAAEGGAREGESGASAAREGERGASAAAGGAGAAREAESGASAAREAESGASAAREGDRGASGAREGERGASAASPEGAAPASEGAAPAPEGAAHPPGHGPHDEIGVSVGPDGDALGLFDRAHTGTATGEHTEGAPEGPDHHAEQRRTAVLAWIAAQPLSDATPGADGPPCAPLKRLIADEPLDPVPALDGVPVRPRAPARRPAARDAADLAPEREDTATQIEVFEAMLERRGARGTEHEDDALSDSGSVGRTAAARSEPPVPHAAAPAGAWARPRTLVLVALAVLAAAWLLEAAR